MEDNKVIQLNSQKVSRNVPKMDLWLPAVAIALGVFGIIMVFSASYYSAMSEYGNPYYYLIRQVIWVGLGVALMAVGAIVDYKVWLKIWPIFYVIGLVLLVAVMVPNVGTTINGATRWINLGGFTIMPGEIAKPCFIVSIAGYFSNHTEYVRRFGLGICAVGVALAVYVGLIMLQPNMSTAFTIVIITFGMFLIAGCKIGPIVGAGSVAIAGALAFIFLDTSGYRYRRYLSFLDPFEDALGNGWNAVQSLLALSNGGIFGQGLGNSIRKNLYLPMPQNDFVLAIIGEELGFVGIIALMATYLFLFYRGSLVCLRAKDYGAKLLAGGIVVWIAAQVILHFAVVTSAMPPTGVLLPFVSYGGNGTMLLYAGIGILMNISKKKNQEV